MICPALLMRGRIIIRLPKYDYFSGDGGGGGSMLCAGRAGGVGVWGVS